MAILLIFIVITDRLYNSKPIKRKIVDMKDKNTRIFMIVLAVISILPYFKYIKTANIKNLFLIDIYLTRIELREYNRGILGYLFSPLSRIIFPFLFIYGIRDKKKFIYYTSLISIILIFLLNGAVKSIFFGIICTVFFCYGNYFKKQMRFIKAFNFTMIVGLFSYIAFNSISILDYIRRIIFVPPKLFDIYYKYFCNNDTLFSHSKVYTLLGGKDSGISSVSRYIGEQVIGTKC